jgi:DNA-binding transcriptional ArsR family regulator
MDAELEFSSNDLALMRFAISPMWEVVTSFRVIREPSAFPVHASWLNQVRPRLAQAGLLNGRLASLVIAGVYVPDFLNPAPADISPALETELEAIRATPAEVVERDLAMFEEQLGTQGRPFVQRLRREHDKALQELTDEIAEYWELAIAPYWSRIRTVLEADIFHRARQVAEQGAARLFTDLHPTLVWKDGTLHMQNRKCFMNRADNGSGLLLVPSAFAWSRILTRGHLLEAPQLTYPARAVGTIWERRASEASEAVSAVLGRSRTMLLTELDVPASTTELASRTGMSAGGVSEHLTALRGAGMVSAHRTGRSVLYARTAVADSLLAAAV